MVQQEKRRMERFPRQECPAPVGNERLPLYREVPHHKDRPNRPAGRSAHYGEQECFGGGKTHKADLQPGFSVRHPDRALRRKPCPSFKRRNKNPQAQTFRCSGHKGGARVFESFGTQ